MPNPLIEVEDDAIDFYNSKNFSKHKKGISRLAKRQQEKLGPVAISEPRQVSVRVVQDIPKLAWSAKLTDGACDIIVGNSVEMGENRIVEGVWDGDFSENGFIKSNYFFGSGVVWDKHVVFAPPRHAWEFLFVLCDKTRGRTFVSNSLNFALSQAGIDRKDDIFMGIVEKLFTSTNEATKAGIDLYDPNVVETENFSLRRMMFYNFTADCEGRIKLLPLKLSIAPRGYDKYRNFLIEKTQSIVNNGTSLSRKKPLAPITPISNGYDSVCVAVLSKEAGVNETITLDITVKGKDDSGAAIARKLGLKTILVTHVLGSKVPTLAVNFSGKLKEQIMEFIATAGIGDDIAFLPFEPHLGNRIFLSGAMGDSVWRRNSTLPAGLPVRVPYGKSLTEFRLRVGFAYVPIPSIGARFPRLIKRMTRSQEMADYTLWKAYDRPFPRRVIEEAGIERGTFAKSKAATSPTPMNQSELFVPSTLAIMKRYKPAK